MTRVGLCRRAARALIAAAVWISPANMCEWAAAMAAESEYVESSFGALAWAAGCFGTALKQLCISIISPRALVAETEGNMGKFAKISAVALIVASALFLFAPTFRQGLKLSAASWSLSDSPRLAEMERLAHKAEANHDAQTLAFVALQLRYSWPPEAQSERDKFADEAVQWDQNLTWIYSYMLAVQIGPEHHDPNDAHWLASLQAWAPNNAAVDAIEASYYWPHAVRGLNPQADRALLAARPRWLSAMNKAFSATNYDSYLSASGELERDVARRDGVMELGNALVMLWGAVNPYAFEDYAKDFLLPAGADFEAKGDLKHAEESYAKVAHLAALIQLHSASDSESMAASELQLAVDPKLEALYEKSGNSAAAQFVAYQLASAQQNKSRLLGIFPGSWSNSRQLFDAYVVQCSLLAMILSLLMIAICGVYFGVRRLRSRRTGGLRGIFSRAAVFGAILLFVSAITMYFGFTPYTEAFQRFLATPNPTDVPEYVLRFWGLQTLPANVIYWFQGPYSPARLYFWYAVIAVGAAIIVWILCRHLMRTFRRSTPMQPAE